MITLCMITICSIHCIMKMLLHITWNPQFSFWDAIYSFLMQDEVIFFSLEKLLSMIYCQYNNKWYWNIMSVYDFQYSFPGKKYRNHWCAKCLNLGKILFVVAVLHPILRLIHTSIVRAETNLPQQLLMYADGSNLWGKNINALWKIKTVC
jgi:hypothetical protein